MEHLYHDWVKAMNYKELVDPELKKNARSIPFNRLIATAGNGYQEISWRLTKVPGNIEEEVLQTEGFQGLPLKTSVFSPACRGDNMPALIYVHRGAFVYKAAVYQKKLACIYAENAGCRVFFPHYHLAPKYQYPAAYEDVMSLYKYVVSHAEELGVDRERICIAGESAGASIAALVCNRYGEEKTQTPCIQLLIYPVTDAEADTDSMKRFCDTPQWDSRSNKRMWRFYCGDNKELRYSASPMYCDLPDAMPETYIETAEFDCLHDEGILYAKKLTDAGTAVTINETKGTFHGYDSAVDAQIVTRNVDIRTAFLRSGFGTTAERR